MYLKRIAVFCLSLVFLTACQTTPKKKEEKEIDVLDYVDPFIGTGFHGHTFPGPVMPHGMFQLSPDTRLNGWDASSGYHYSDTTIYGFSHTHLSGTGIGDLGDVLILPFTGTTEDKPIAQFDKEAEKAKVGHYEVSFSNFPVKAELASGLRSGMHRYSFDPSEKARVLVDIGHILQRTWSHDNVRNTLEVVNNTTLRGLKDSRGWAYDHKLYYYIEFSQPFTIDEVNVDGNGAAQGDQFDGKNIFAYLSFQDLKDPLLIRVGISAVDAQGAEANLRAETDHWDFERIVEENRKTWTKALGNIRVAASDPAELRTFYTALYHSKIAPMLYQDADGRFRGMDKEIYQADEGQTNYTVYSLWDTFRALHPLMTITDEKRTAEWANNLIQKYEEGGILPMWPLAANYTGTMVGYPAVANLADALVKDIPGIDKERALKAAVNSAMYKPELVADTKNPRKKALMPEYNKYVNEGKHIPSDKEIKSVSFGLEMAYYDWCIAQIAELAKNDSLKKVFDHRAKNYALYFDAETGFMRGKNEDGSWSTPFNPKYSSHDKADYVEGNAWQWTWFVPHDIDGFVELYGSKEAFNQKLDSLFSTSSEIVGEDASGDITGLIGQYAHGNEPSHHIAYFYTYTGQPWKTQELVDQILREFYSDQPDGIIGNEDCGQMSAWYVLNAMGFYQLAPGRDEYVIGRPLFDQSEIRLESGKKFVIEVENNSKENKYVKEAYLNGKKLPGLFFGHQDIRDGGTLKIVMTEKPKM